MSAIASTPIDAEAKNAPTSGRLFFLDLSAGRILSANPDGSDLKTIIKPPANGCPPGRMWQHRQCPSAARTSPLATDSAEKLAGFGRSMGAICCSPGE